MRYEGQQMICPSCQRDLEVPRDVIFLRQIVDPNDRPTLFAYYCPGCEGEVVSEKEHVGQYGVCPHCRCVAEVPMWGHEAKPEPPPPSPSADPLASLKECAPIRCPKCHERIPAQAQVCRRCGTAVDSEALHRDRDSH